MDALLRVNGQVTLWLARLAAVALAIIAVVTFCDVIGRYVLNLPFTVTVELTEVAMAFVVYFGVGLVTHENAHISADVVTLRLSPRLRALFEVVTNLLALGFLVLVVWRLWGRAAELYGTADVTQVWRLPLWPVAGAVAFGSLFLLTGVMLQLIIAAARVIDPQRYAAPAPSAAPYRE